MTVKELIDKLSEFDETLEVEITSGSGWDCYGKSIDRVYTDEVFCEGKLIID